MAATIELINLYRFPMGRIAFALGDTARRARALSEPAPDVAELATRGASAAREALEKQSQYQSVVAGGGKYPRGTTVVDQRVDQCLAGTQGYLVSQVTLFGEAGRGKAAQRLLEALFAEGVKAITQLPFTAQHERVSALLAAAESAELAGALKALPEMAVMLAEVRLHNDEYGRLLRRVATTPSSPEMRQVRNRCQELLAATVGLILGRFTLREDAEGRDHLLAPILAQNEAIRRARRRKSVPADTDPDTGEELYASAGGPGNPGDAATADTGQPATAAGPDDTAPAR